MPSLPRAARKEIDTKIKVKTTADRPMIRVYPRNPPGRMLCRGLASARKKPVCTFAQDKPRQHVTNIPVDPTVERDVELPGANVSGKKISPLIISKWVA